MNIELAGVTKYFHTDACTIFSDCSWIFQAGQTYALVGPSGSGKSTLLAMLAGFEKPNCGTIACGDRAYDAMCTAERQRILQKSISFLFQDPYLLDELTVYENCMVRVYSAYGTHTMSKEYSERVMSLLELVGLADKKDALPYTLSGGERQRVALVRALVIRPAWLLADEPTAHLDDHSADRVMNTIKRYVREYGMGLIMACHDKQYYATCTHICRVHNKKICKGEL